jgi:hypothetical protein
MSMERRSVEVIIKALPLPAPGLTIDGPALPSAVLELRPP